jgi:hypothetical protein
MTSLSKNDKVLCGIYGALAAIALVATWWNNIAFFRLENSNGLIGFVQAGYANYASTSLTNDVLLTALAAFVFMVVEARRVGIPHVWIYPLLSIVVAISVAVPLYLIARQVKLAEGRPVDQGD